MPNLADAPVPVLTFRLLASGLPCTGLQVAALLTKVPPQHLFMQPIVLAYCLRQVVLFHRLMPMVLAISLQQLRQMMAGLTGDSAQHWRGLSIDVPYFHCWWSRFHQMMNLLPIVELLPCRQHELPIGQPWNPAQTCTGP